MADICYGVANDDEAASAVCEPRPRIAARRRRMDIRRLRFLLRAGPPGERVEEMEEGCKRKKQGKNETTSRMAFCRSTVDEYAGAVENGILEPESAKDDDELSGESPVLDVSPSLITVIEEELYPKFGVASVYGRRRNMEDAVAIHPLFCRKHPEYFRSIWHYFGVYDGHGCSHVATRCRERLHELVQEELSVEEEWRGTMERSFTRMDKEVVLWNESVLGATCRCELQTPDCDAVGSTAVVSIITPERIIVANCGDSRAVLCRKGKPLPLSSDHKPDRPDELDRIEAAGGRVIYWEGPRVLGALAMSRAIGDNYLKPYVSCEPEVTITDRTGDDDCLILATDGLWDVVSNETACAVARMCLRGKARGRRRRTAEATAVVEEEEGEGEVEKDMVGSRKEVKEERSDRACTEAAALLTQLALARHSTDNVSVVVINLRRRH